MSKAIRKIHWVIAQNGSINKNAFILIYCLALGSKSLVSPWCSTLSGVYANKFPGLEVFEFEVEDITHSLSINLGVFQDP